jgi:hypothetical protein
MNPSSRGDSGYVISRPPQTHQQQQGWRSAEFRQAYALTLPRQQSTRLGKMYTEPLFLLATPTTSLSGPHSTAARFSVSGSTGTKHTVTLTGDGKIDCTCLDARIHARRANCACKHVCFVVFRAMGFADLSFFQRDRTLTPEQVRKCVEVAAGRLGMDSSAMRPNEEKEEGCPHHATSGISAVQFKTPAKDIVPDVDECPICYDVLLEPGTTIETVGPLAQMLRWCPACHNALHYGCVAKWIANAPKPTCVMCRSPAWRAWKGE